MDVAEEEAVAAIQRCLDDRDLWFELKAVALELQDATEDMNEVLAEIEGKFASLKLRPGWVPLNEKEALTWNGANILFDNGVKPERLLHSSRAKRLLGIDALEPLYEELTRPRLIPADLKRTPE